MIEVTTDINQWLDWLVVAIAQPYNAETLDIASSEYVAMHINAKGYMADPVASVNGVILEARSAKSHDINDIVAELSGKDVYLYRVHYYQYRPTNKTFNHETMSFDYSKALTVEKPWWLVRYSELTK